MEVSGRNLELRIKARMLCELKVPWTAPEYQRTLAQLVDACSDQRVDLRGLTRDEILEEDASSAILWGLSERLGREWAEEVLAPRVLRVEAEPHRNAAREELRVMVYDKVSRLLPDGFGAAALGLRARRHYIVDDIIALLSDASPVRHAARLLLAIAIPLEYSSIDALCAASRKRGAQLRKRPLHQRIIQRAAWRLEFGGWKTVFSPTQALGIGIWRIDFDTELRHWCSEQPGALIEVLRADYNGLWGQSALRTRSISREVLRYTLNAIRTAGLPTAALDSILVWLSRVRVSFPKISQPTPFDLRLLPFEDVLFFCKALQNRKIAEDRPLGEAAITGFRRRAKRPRTDVQTGMKSGEKVLESSVLALISSDGAVAPVMKRSLSALLDATMISLCSAPLFVILMAIDALGLDWDFRLLTSSSIACVAVAYGTFFALNDAPTPGMRWQELRIATFAGGDPTKKQRVLRLLGNALSWTTGLGLLWALVDEEALTWADHISQTFVTRSTLASGRSAMSTAEPPDRASAASGPARPLRRGQGSGRETDTFLRAAHHAVGHVMVMHALGITLDALVVVDKDVYLSAAVSCLANPIEEYKASWRQACLIRRAGEVAERRFLGESEVLSRLCWYDDYREISRAFTQNECSVNEGSEGEEARLDAFMVLLSTILERWLDKAVVKAAFQECINELERSRSQGSDWRSQGEVSGEVLRMHLAEIMPGDDFFF